MEKVPQTSESSADNTADVFDWNNYDSDVEELREYTGEDNK